MPMAKQNLKKQFFEFQLQIATDEKQPISVKTFSSAGLEVMVM